MVFLKLSDIDTVKEQFAADVFIESRWREKSLDHGKVVFYQTAVTLEFGIGGGGHYCHHWCYEMSLETKPFHIRRMDS